MKSVLPGLGCSCYEYRSKNTEYIGLYHADQESQHAHDRWKYKRRYRKQDSNRDFAAHHIAEEPNCESQSAGEFADDIERQHDESGFQIRFQIRNDSGFQNSEKRNRYEYADGKSCCCGE